MDSEEKKSNCNQIGLQDEPSEESLLVKAEISRDNFELILCNSTDKATDIIANIDFHAFFIEDSGISDWLDKYNNATSSIKHNNQFQNTGSTHFDDGTGLYSPLAERLRNRKQGTKVLFTDKRNIPANTFLYARKLIRDICKSLKIPGHSGKLIQVAGEIYNLAKFQHPRYFQSYFRDMVSINAKFLNLLKNHSDLIGILRQMYCSYHLPKGKKPSLQIIGANVLSITDLLLETIELDKPLSGEELLVVSQALRNLAPRFFLKEVVESLITILENEVMLSSSHDYNRIAIYSNRPASLFAVENHLRNKGFQVFNSDTLEAFVDTFKSQHPGIIILKLHSSSGEIINVLQFLSNNGININAISTFLIVKGNVVHHLSSIINMDSVDILDLESSLDVLMFKIAKIREKLEEPAELNESGNHGQSVSAGNLKDMSLIDLLQAMGPSKRTARIKINHEGNASEHLIFYLSQGNIIFAQMGNLLGEMAIFRALAWEKGTWTIEQISDEDLPEPNNELPNEYILMEGCRLLDEKSNNAEIL